MTLHTRRVRMLRWLGGLAAFALIAAPPLGAQGLAEYDYENLSFRGLGFDVGYIWPNRVTPTAAYSLRFDLGYLGPGVRVIPSATYWTSRLRGRELDRLANQMNQLEALQREGVTVEASDLGPIDWSDISLSADGHYVWVGPMNVLPYVGVGMGVHRMRGRGPLIEGTLFEDLLGSVTAGASLIAGFDLAPAGRSLRLYAEGRYTLLNSVSYPGLRLGAAFMLPRSGGWVGRRAPSGGSTDMGMATDRGSAGR
jgi:hypothetical protein